MTVHIALALSLVLTATRWQDAPTSSRAPASAPIFEEAASPTPAATPVAAPRVEVVSAPARGRPPEPRWKGTGLIVTAGLFGAGGLAFNIARIATGRNLCRELRYNEQTQSVENADACLNGGFALGGLALGALIMNSTAFGLAAGAGVQRGRWAAHRSRFVGDRDPNTKLQIGLGAGLLGAGIIGYLAVRIASYADVLGQQTCSERYPIDDLTDPMARANVNPFSRCMGGRISGYLSGIAVTQTMSIVGVGLLTHGVALRRERRLLEYIASGRLRVQPTLGRSFVGLSLGGRF